MLSRRKFMETGVTLAGGTMLGGCALPGAGSGPKLALPTPAQVEWQDCETGIIFHLDMPIVAGDDTHNNATKKTFDPKVYNPVDLDTDQWVAAAKAAGAKYAIFTATHFNGFMQWQSDLYPYGLKQAAWRSGKGDIVGDFVTSCRKMNIKPGIYLSTHRNAYQTVWGHYVDWGKGKGTAKQAAFNRIAEKMTEELCSRYGKLVQIWYDAGVKLPHEGGPDVLPIFEKYQPNSVFYNSSRRSDFRWIGNEDGHSDYPCWSTMPGPEKGAISHNSSTWRKILGCGDPNGTVWSPGMVDTVLRGKNNHAWFWHPGEDNTIHTLDELMNMVYTSIGSNCNLVLGAVINNRGLVPEPDVKRMEEFGRETARRLGTPIAATSGRGRTLELKLKQPHRIDHVVIMEDIMKGERIQAYNLETLVPGGRWEPLAQGISVGHKRIHKVSPRETASVRLNISKSKTRPQIRKLAVFGTA